MTICVKNLEVCVTLLLLGQSNFRLITKHPTHYGGQSIRIIFLVTWSNRGKIEELAMPLVKALLTRKVQLTPPPLSGPKDGLNTFLRPGIETRLLDPARIVFSA